MLRFDGVFKRFDDVQALTGLDLQVAPGQVLGFLGANGAGKTTAMRVVFGLVRQDRGTVTWNGRPITERRRSTFGYMPEERGLYPKMEVADQLRYFGRLHGMERAAAAEAVDGWLERFGLAERGSSRLEELSHGNQQRVQLIAAMAHDPPLLVLDEPFSGLDPIAASTMASVLRERAGAGTAVLFSSHQLDVVENLCEDVAIIDRGRIVLAGRVLEIRASSPVRYVEVTGDMARADAWTAVIPGVEVVAVEPDRVRLRVPADASMERIASAAAAEGAVTGFSFEPPGLSEVFREAVTP